MGGDHLASQTWTQDCCDTTLITATLIGGARTARSQTMMNAFFTNADLVPLAGVALANAKCFSPMPALLRARAENVLTISPLPLVAVTGNNAGQVAYSLTATHDPYVLAGTMPGLLVGLFYVFTAYSVSSESRLLIKTASVTYLLALGTAALLSFGCPSIVCTPTDTFGSLTVSLLLLFYVSPLPTMYDAFLRKNAERIHAPMALATLCNAALWLIYGLSMGDWHMYVPQGVGVTLAATQLVMVGVWSDWNRDMLQ